MDTVFMFLCTILVMLMLPALALFYGGMVRSKNVLSTTMHTYVSLAVVSVQWILIGFSLAFGASQFGLFGNFDFVGLKGVGFEAGEGESIPFALFMMFQMMFAALTPAIMSGAFAERMRFSAFIIFLVLWTTFVYDPLAHWVWGGGWLMEMGALDFAGGTVVHIASGISGLVVAIVLGKRKIKGESKPHHVPLTIFGAGLLWFGWYGFNVGSALTLDAVAINALIVTTIATAMGSLGWMFSQWIVDKKPTALGAANGIVAGLVAITPACGFVGPAASVIVGLASGIICYFAVSKLKSIMKYDDTLDAFGLHGFGGIWGGIATGLFASTAVNEAGANGLFFGGGFELLLIQIVAIIATLAFAGIMTYILVKLVGLFIPLRVEEEEEDKGLDESLHGEKAYS